MAGAASIAPPVVVKKSRLDGLIGALCALLGIESDAAFFMISPLACFVGNRKIMDYMSVPGCHGILLKVFIDIHLNQPVVIAS
jgi:hypothetical protein